MLVCICLYLKSFQKTEHVNKDHIYKMHPEKDICRSKENILSKTAFQAKNGLISVSASNNNSSNNNSNMLLKKQRNVAPTSIKYSSNEKQAWKVAVSEHAKNTINPIRRICDSLSVAPNPHKPLIKLHLGDPTITGALSPCPVVDDAINEALKSHSYNGYGPAVGILEAREAVSRHYTHPEAPFTADDVILTSGCSHSLQIAIEALANPGDNILVPSPGFPLYSTLMRPHGIEDRFYRLSMTGDVQIDLVQMESLIDCRTRAIIINNPSNPTGAVFSKSHLEAVLQIAYKYKIPIIADEIYGDLTYNGAQFIPMATLYPKVPMITCDGIGKRYLVPGWRLGWLIIHDRFGALSDVRQGLISLSQKIVGPCALIQGALAKILDETPVSFFEQIKKLLSSNAKTVYDYLSRVPGLRPVRPNGAMYMIIGIEEQFFGKENEFIQGLISEESVFCLPGAAFNSNNCFRIVLTYTEEVTREACERISQYCNRRLVNMRRVLNARRRAGTSLLSCGQDADGFSSDGSECESCFMESE